MRFELDWRDRRVGSMQTPRRFLDYNVDDESLYERHGYDLISCLGWFVPEEDERAAERLLGKESADVEGRISIYVCPEDGDVYCGALSAKVDRKAEWIVWHEIAHSTYDFGAAAWNHRLIGWDDVRFPADDYRRAITERPRATT